MADPVAFSVPAMSGGDATYSYTKNSYYQRKAASFVKESIDGIIAEKLEIKNVSVGASNTIRIVDVGCSTGPNTFFAVHGLIEAIKRKYQHHCLASQMPEFQVFFNDRVTNDFNTLFKSLPEDKPYFAAGVPGSFYDRLFPNSSIDLVYSSMALHWLSKVPEELTDKDSPQFNKGRIHYVNAPDFVLNAYATQFRKDMDTFFSARAKEVVQGGMMVLNMAGNKNGMPLSQNPTGIMFGSLELSLLDMVKQGLISEDQVNSFNIPIYVPSAEAMIMAVERNGFFSIEMIEMKDASKMMKMLSVVELTAHTRAGMEGMLSKHFGGEHIEDIFNGLETKFKDSFESLRNMTEVAGSLFVAVKRK